MLAIVVAGITNYCTLWSTYIVYTLTKGVVASYTSVSWDCGRWGTIEEDTAAAGEGRAAISTFTCTSCGPWWPLSVGITGDVGESTSSIMMGSSPRDDCLKALRTLLGEIGDLDWTLFLYLFLSLLCTLVRWCWMGSKRWSQACSRSENGSMFFMWSAWG